MPRVLICDYVGLELDLDGNPNPAEVREYIVEKGGVFHSGAYDGPESAYVAERINFYYMPDLSAEADFLRLTTGGVFDAVIAAATPIPAAANFPMGGVRIGAGTGNMRSASWGGPNGIGGEAPLMNTPGTNSVATAQMVVKAMFSRRPNLPFDELHERVMAGVFDTRRDIQNYPAAKLEGQRIAVLGNGNIGSEVAAIARALRMDVVVYARERHRASIEKRGHRYAASIREAAAGADFLTIHLGLGRLDAATGRYANQAIIDADVLSRLRPNAVLVNFDRGELVNVADLEGALEASRVGDVFVDADVLLDAETGTPGGPLAPYMAMARRFRGRVTLLPHVAADTDHPSRVTGAKRAVDQIFDAIERKVVPNAVGEIPLGYTVSE